MSSLQVRHREAFGWQQLMRAGVVVGFAVALLGAAPPVLGGEQARVLRVGKSEALKRLGDAIRTARSGDVIEVEPGTYPGDTAVISQAQLTIIGKGGFAVIPASGADAEGKAIWVVRGQDVRIENIAFTGSRVPDGNGAGIRHESGRLHVVSCVFMDNQSGIQTSNEPSIELFIERSELGRNGTGDGQTHNVYAGRIAKVTVIGSYIHDAKNGHLIKSRAKETRVLYNRLEGGAASYELDFPEGGLAYVIGNLVTQDSSTGNPAMISMGEEFYHWSRNELYLINNTLDDRMPGGRFLQMRPGASRLKVFNNVLLGAQQVERTFAGEYGGNVQAASVSDLSGWTEYRPDRSYRSAGKAVDPGSANGIPLRPAFEYVHPRMLVPVTGLPYSAGAYQRLR